MTPLLRIRTALGGYLYGVALLVAFGAMLLTAWLTGAFDAAVPPARPTECSRTLC